MIIIIINILYCRLVVDTATAIQFVIDIAKGMAFIHRFHMKDIKMMTMFMMMMKMTVMVILVEMIIISSLNCLADRL